MSRSRTFGRRPGRPSGAGLRPRSLRPNKLKAYLRLSRTFNRVVHAGGEVRFSRVEPVNNEERFRLNLIPADISWQTGRPWWIAPEETP